MESVLLGLPLESGRESGAAMEGDEKGGGGGVTLEELRRKMVEFAREREWEQYHSPRNLLLALVGEVGELSEIFQWKGEVPRGLPGWGDDEKVHLGEELSDVLLYLVQLAHTCDVDLGRAALRKVELNAIKYPVGRRRSSKGSSDNNEYTAGGYAVTGPTDGGSGGGSDSSTKYTSTTSSSSSGGSDEEEAAAAP